MDVKQLDESEVRAKWNEIAGVVNRLAQRVADSNDFPVEPGSSLAGDDAAAHPFEVSQAIRHLINAAVDQLHGIKTLHVEAEAQQLAVIPTLARAALENTATALWILGPVKRDQRLERVLRWHTRNYHDEQSTVGHLVGSATEDNLAHILRVAAERSLDQKQVSSGYKITTPIDGAMEYTAIGVRFLWSVSSGFAHGRPWVYQGLLERETLTVGGGHQVRLLKPRKEIVLWLTLQAVHLLGELIRLRDRRAGLIMPPLPNGAPDPGP